MAEGEAAAAGAPTVDAESVAAFQRAQKLLRRKVDVKALPLLDAPTRPIGTEALAGKRVALYFAAGWCPMCTSFEPALEKYRAYFEQSKAFARESMMHT